MDIIRKANLSEISALRRLINREAESGSMLPRPLIELYELARDFHVCMDEQGVVGCCALHIDMEDLAEIRSLVVREDRRGCGVGERLVRTCLDEAQSLGIVQVYALTRVPEFFKRIGFTPLDKRELPHKVFNDCVRCPLFPDCDEVALAYNMGRHRPKNTAS